MLLSSFARNSDRSLFFSTIFTLTVSRLSSRFFARLNPILPPPIINIEKGISPLDKVELEIKYISGDIKKIKTLCRIDTKNELEYYKNGGILQYVLRNMI